MPFRPSMLCLFCAALLGAPTAVRAQCAPGEARLPADRDNTLYEDAAGDLSNGAGQFIFAGRTASDRLRRALLHFDVAGALPAGATVTSATLWLDMSMTAAGPQDVSLHAVALDWGEGASAAGGPEGGGAAAAPGDATWLHTFFDTDFWVTPGGDFALGDSATTTVDDVGAYSWGSTDGTVAVVQAWLDEPATNFGWILIGNETASMTAKRFGSRDNLDPAATPALCVGFVAPGPVEIPTLGAAGLLLLALGLAGLAVRRLR